MADHWVAGRVEERASLVRGLSSGAFVSIIGRAGSGKTHLVRWLTAEAERRGCFVLQCTPAAIESTIAASALSEVLSRLPPSRFAELEEGHSEALVELARGIGTIDSSSARAAFDELIAAIALERSLIVVLDDVQWIDPFSAEILAYALRRHGRNVPVVAAARSETNSLLLDALGSRVEVARLDLGPMSEEDLAAVAAHELGGPSPICLAMAQLARGSPLRARELARLFGHDRNGVLRSEHMGVESNAFAPAVELLGEKAAEVLFAAVSLSDAHVDTLAAVFGNDVTIRALDECVARRLIRIVDRRIEPDHPLVVDAITASVSALARAEIHRRLADVVAGPVQRAHHLSESNVGRTIEVAAEILDGSRIAARTGSLVLAHQLAVRVPMFLPPEATGELFQAQIWLASVEFIADDYAAATSRLLRLIDSEPPGPSRTDAMLALANIEAWGVDPIAGYVRYTEVLADDTIGSSASAQAAVQLAVLALAAGLTSAALDFAVRGYAFAVESEGQLLAEAEAVLATTRFFVGDGLDHELVDRALAREDPENPLSYQAPPLQWAPFLWRWSGDRRALDGFRRRRVVSLARGATTTVAIGLSSEIHLLLERGRTIEAATIMQRSVAIAQYENPLAVAMASLGQARFLAHTDGSSSAKVLALVTDAEQMLDEVGFGFGRIESHAIRLAELARTDVGAAAAAAMESLDWYQTTGLSDLGLMQGLLDAVEALVVASHPDRQLFLNLLDSVDPNRADLSAAQRWRDCCIAVLDGAPHGIEDLDALHADWLALDNTFWAARALVLSARVMRRSGHRRESADRFGRSRTLFVRIGATAWAETVVGEAERDGRPRIHGGSTLTGNERRVAELATGGATNRDIAQAMFISEKTVEATLTAVYRKLGVARRSQLHLALRPPD